MKKILVTGGSGFIGSNFIINQINNTDNKIFNLDMLTYAGNNENLLSVIDSDNYSFIKGSINNNKLVESLFKKFSPDCILNFAAETHVDKSIHSPNSFIDTNIYGTLCLLQVSLEYYKSNQSFRFIHVSTDEVYGSLDKNEIPFTETHPYNPSSPYSASKASSDHLVRAWQKTYGLPTIISNCSNNYGPYQNPEKLIPLIITNCLNEKPLPLYGDGRHIRDWLYVGDHCEALYKIINEATPGESYNIGGNNEIKNIDIVTKICEILDGLRPRNKQSSYINLIKYVQDRPGHDYRYAINSSKIKNDLNWKPKESFESGILETIKWYLENEGWWKKIQENPNNY